LDLLDQRNNLKERLQSLEEEEQWLLNAAALSERGFVELAVEDGALPDAPLDHPRLPPLPLTSKRTPAAVNRSADAQRIAAMLM
jgi:hypothetical protein